MLALMQMYFFILACVLLSACADVRSDGNSLNASSVSLAILSRSSSASSVASVVSSDAKQPPAISQASEFDPLAAAPIDLPASVDIPVPFTSQAPHANWDALHEETCEEASLLMAEYYLRGATFTPDIAEQELQNIVQWQTDHGYPYDVTIEELAVAAREYLGRRAKVYSGSDVTIENIKRLLVAGYPVIIPAAGQDLGNPYFSGDGPPYHMLIIRGYTRFGNFITNDPGTRRGEEYSYDQDVIDRVIHDWSGAKETIRQGKRAMLVIEP